MRGEREQQVSSQGFHISRLALASLRGRDVTQRSPGVTFPKNSCKGGDAVDYARFRLEKKKTNLFAGKKHAEFCLLAFCVRGFPNVIP